MTAWLEQAWLVRYLNRRLSSEEVTWFESYVLDKPELLATIEADTRLRDALAADAAMRHKELSVADESRQGGAMSAGAVQPAPTGGSPLRPRGLEWFALAASLAIGVGLGWLGERGTVTGHGGPAAIASPTRIVYDTLRDGSSTPRIEHADSASPYVLVEIAIPPDAEQITLSGEGVGEQQLTLSPDGFASVLLERSRVDKKQGLQIRYARAGQTVAKNIDLPPVEQ